MAVTAPSTVLPLPRESARTARPLTRELAGWIAEQADTPLPEPVSRFIRLALLDNLGVGLYGMAEPWTRMVLDWARQGSDPAAGTASVWGEAGPSLRAADAALVNGCAIHAFELDDFVAKLHPGAPVVAAAMAVGERLDSDGLALERAVAAGYEVMTRISLALDPSAARLRGWHLTGVVGPLGAAAAAAVLLGLDAERTAWALGLAATQGAGLFAFTADGSMSKRLHPGKAAHSGVMAAELAAAGFTGPASVLEVEDGGYLAAFSDVVHPDLVVEGLGSVWQLLGTHFKPYSCCGSLHAYVDAAKAVRGILGGAPPPGATVRAGLARVVDVQCGYDYAPGSVLNAQMSARYSIAVALAEGEALPPQFTEAKMADPAIVELAQRMELPHDPAMDSVYPNHYCGWVEVELAPGEVERAYYHDPSGAPTHPEHDDAIVAKFRALMRDAAAAPADPQALIDACLALDGSGARGLAMLMRAG